MTTDTTDTTDTSWDTGVGVMEKPSEKLKQPSMYVVFVHNDPITPREFVVGVLMRYFNKTMEQAIQVMMIAHSQGLGAAGIYTKEIAETKTDLANTYSRTEGRPLYFSFEKQ